MSSDSFHTPSATAQTSTDRWACLKHEMAKWRNGEMAKWRNGEMAKWRNGKMVKWY